MEKQKKVITLSDLVGEHKLTAVDFSSEPISDGYNEGDLANAISFTLDGVTYRVQEDPSDGYRSYAREIEVLGKARLANRFKACKVFVRYVDGARNYATANDIIEMVDVKTGKVVLEVGTENTDDYYPFYVANFTPEHMASNAKVK